MLLGRQGAEEQLTLLLLSVLELLLTEEAKQSVHIQSPQEYFTSRLSFFGETFNMVKPQDVK